MIKRILQALALLFVAAWVISMNSCMNFRKSDKKVRQHFEEKNISVDIHRVSYGDRTVRYIQTGCTDPNCPVVLFVHGAPGGADAWFDFMEDSLLRQKARLVSIDRPGYGYSDFGTAVVSVVEQAEAVNAVLQRSGNGPAILVGHSYGGPVIGKYAVDHPGRVKALFMVAPVNDPDSEVEFWYANIGRWKLTRWMVSKAMRVATDEKFAHIAELRNMIPDWSRLTMPVVHMHGKKDNLASFDNIAFSKKHIPQHLLRTIELEKGNHLLIFNRVPAVKQEIVDLLD